jgi:hypothetical protein
MNSQRVGFIMSVAAGSAWPFPESDFTQKRHDQWGAWLTPTYRLLACPDTDVPYSTTVDFMAVVRTLHPQGEDTVWDTGFRLLWQPNKEFNVSLETLHRSKAADGTCDGGKRTGGVAEYTVSDGLVIYGSFGKDVPSATGRAPLVSLFGLNIGFGKPAADPPLLRGILIGAVGTELVGLPMRQAEILLASIHSIWGSTGPYRGNVVPFAR